MSWSLLQNTLLVGGGTALLALFLGTAGALCLIGLPPVLRRLGLALMVAVLALPPFLVTNTWLSLLGSEGWLADWFPGDLYSLWGTIWVLGLLFWPIPMVLIAAVWHQLDPSHLEVEPALHGRAAVRWLFWPAARIAWIQGGLIVLVLAINNLSVPAILQTNVFPLRVWVRFNSTYDFGEAMLLSLPLLVMPLLPVLVLRIRPVHWPRGGGPIPWRLFRDRLGGVWKAAAAITGAAVAFGLMIPLIQILGEADTWTELGAVWAADREALRHSLIYAAGTATFCLALAMLVWRWPIGGLLWIPLLVPGITIGIGAIYLLNRPVFDGFYESVGLVILAYSVRYLVVSWYGVRHAARRVDRDLLDVARLHGAGPWRRLRLVYWPQVGHFGLALWYMTYLLCLWDVETLILIVPPGGETLSSRVFDLLHYGHMAQVNAHCLLLLGVAVLPLLVWGTAKAVRTAIAGALRGVSLRAAQRSAGLSLGMGLLLPLLPACTPAGENDPAPKSLESSLFSHVQVIGSRGTGPGEFNKPRSITVDREDYVYVVDMTGRVQKFAPDGQYAMSWQMPEIDKGAPKGMGLDAEGNIVVIETHYSRINHFSPEGERVAQWGETGSREGAFYLPRAVVTNSAGELFICEYGRQDRVQKFSPYGEELLNRFGRPGSGPGELNRPEGLAIDGNGRVYVADSCNHRIQVFDPDGTLVRMFGQPGGGRAEMSYPYDIDIDAQGRQYICEYGNSRIKVVNAEGEVVELLGGSGSAPGDLHNPWSIALDSEGNLYVADAGNHRIQKWIRR